VAHVSLVTKKDHCGECLMSDEKHSRYMFVKSANVEARDSIGKQ